MIDGVFAFVLYAFALYDPRNRSLHVDMIGIRPLYWSMGYGRKRNRYVFFFALVLVAFAAGHPAGRPAGRPGIGKWEKNI